jgi:hypothetical protein
VNDFARCDPATARVSTRSQTHRGPAIVQCSPLPCLVGDAWCRSRAGMRPGRDVLKSGSQATNRALVELPDQELSRVRGLSRGGSGFPVRDESVRIADPDVPCGRVLAAQRLARGDRGRAQNSAQPCEFWLARAKNGQRRGFRLERAGRISRPVHSTALPPFHADTKASDPRRPAQPLPPRSSARTIIHPYSPLAKWCE